MKLQFFVLAFLLVSLQSAPYIYGQTTTIKNAEITFEFPSKRVKGNIEGFKSSSTIDWKNPENSIFKGSVDVETLDTYNALRNWSLKKGRYFDANDHPRIYFESTDVVLEGQKIVVSGALTLKGTTKPISILFVKYGKRLVGTTELFSSDYGINIKKKQEDNLVKVNLVFDLN